MSTFSKLKKAKFIMHGKYFDLINKNKYTKKVALITSKKYKNKLYEDLYVKKALNKEHILCDILAYEDNLSLEKYDLVIIRTIWGYQNNLTKFYKFLDMLRDNDIKVYNDINIIRDNVNKELQYNLFLENNIKTMGSTFYNDVREIKMNGRFVVKPVISASGNNTYLCNNTCNHDIKGRVMVQKYFDAIKNGEYSLIYFNNKFSYAIKRYPGIIFNKKSLEYIDNIDEDLLIFGNNISKLYPNNLFLRIDIIDDDKNYLVLETEAVDPSFFLDSIKDKTILNEKLTEYVTAIKNKME